MIPGKQYKPEDFAEAAWRRRWFIVVPFVLVTLGTVIVSELLPDRYRSDALLLIVPQRVPEDYVRPTVTTRLDERLQSIGQEILSRTRLERIIQEFDLYPTERRRLIMEDVIESMRSRDVRIGRPLGRGDGGAFTVSFESDNPRTAMLVTERLASLFISENLQDRSVFADMTDQFLSSQLEEARRQLIEHEKRLEVFRRANPGQMPAQLDANQQALQSTQMQLQGLQESVNRDRDRQLMLHRQIVDLTAAAEVEQESQSSQPASDDATAPTATQLESARAALRRLEMRLKPEHPDIRIQKRTIRDLEQKLAAEALNQPVSAAAKPLTPTQTARNSKLAELQAETELLDRRIASKQDDEARLIASMAVFRQRIEAIPTVESRLTELMRDYTTLQTTYQSLLTKSQEAKVAANLERRQIGEQFKIIDQPRLPQRPTSPNRIRINLLGALFGLMLGLGLAALLEYRDSSLRSEEDVVSALALPVVALVPTMSTVVERARHRRMRMLIASSVTVLFVVSVAVVAWKLRVLAMWVR